MLQKILSSLVSASIALSPISVSANEYFFRYNVGSVIKTGDPIVTPEFEPGNDISVSYVTPVGEQFTKRLPVATDNVAQWILDEGDIPAGISINRATGVLSGSAVQANKFTATYFGFDSYGNQIARAVVNFSVFERLGVGTKVDFYTHTNQYFYAQIPTPAGVSVSRWEAFPDLTDPAGMGTRNGAFDGTPTAEGEYPVGWQGYDYANRPVAYAWGSFLVENGPKLDKIADQSIDLSLGQKFNIQANVARKLGTVTYKLVPVDGRPAGLTFSSQTGLLGGAYSTYDTSAQFYIQARDVADGTTGVSNTFTLKTEAELLDISNIDSLSGTVGEVFERKFPKGTGNAVYTLIQGTIPDGLTLSPEGVLSGTPKMRGTFEGLKIQVSGSGITTTPSNEFRIYIKPAGFSAEGTFVHAQVNKPFNIPAPKVTGAVAPVSFEMREGTSLVGDMTFTDGTFNSIGGIATEGDYQFPMKVTSGGFTVNAYNYLRVHAEPELTYTNSTEVKLLGREYLRPTFNFDDAYGSPLFSAVDLPSWLSLNTRTGVLTATPDMTVAPGTYGPFTVEVSDDFKVSTPSNPFTVVVTDRPAVSGVMLDQTVDRLIENHFEFTGRLADLKEVTGQATVSVVGGNLPSTLEIRSAYNGYLYITGTTSDPVGTVYSNVVVKVSDDHGDKYSWTSEPFNVTVIEPQDVRAISGSLDFEHVWSVNKPLQKLALPEVANAYGQVTYTLDPVAVEAFGVYLENGTVGSSQTVRKMVRGSFTVAGTYQIPYQIRDELDRDPVSGMITIVIQPKMELEEETTSGAITFHRGTYAEFKPERKNGIAPFTYDLLPSESALPEGLYFSRASGMIYGTPKVETTVAVTIKVTDSLTEEASTEAFNIVVGAPLPFSFAFGDTPIKTGNFEAVRPTLTNPLGGQGDIVWTFSGDFPAGMTPVTDVNSGLYGTIAGTPSAPGVYGNIFVSAYDNVAKQRYPKTGSEQIRITVLPANEISFADQTFTAPASSDPENFQLKADYVNAPATYRVAEGADPLADNIVLNPTTGFISGTFPTANNYSTAVTVSDAYGSKTANVGFTIKEPIKVTVDQAYSFNQYDETDQIAPITENAIGNVSYALTNDSPALPLDLVLNPTTGVISGQVTDEPKTISGYKIIATDAFDSNQDVSEAFSITIAAREQMLVADMQIDSPAYTTIDRQIGVEKEYAPVTFTFTPDLPPELTVVDGRLTGTFERAYSNTFTVRAVDAKGGSLGTDTATITINITDRDQLTLNGEALPVTLKQFDDRGPITPFTTENELATVSWSISPALPADLTFANGSISGKPTVQLDPTVYTITATDNIGGDRGTASKTFTLEVTARDALKLNGPDFKLFNLYSDGYFDLSAENAIDGQTYSVEPALPTYFSLDENTGRITATPQAALSSTEFTFKVTDGVGAEKERKINLSVGDRFAPVITTDAATPLAAIAKSPFTYTLSKDRVYGSASWELVSGTLPANVYFTEEGSFTGTPEQAGVTENLVVRVIDTINGIATPSATKAFSLNVAAAPNDGGGDTGGGDTGGDGGDGDGDNGGGTTDPTPITITPAPAGQRVGQLLNSAFPSVDNAIGDKSFTATGLEGTGLSIDPLTGIISGTPNTVGTITAVVTVTDSAGRSASGTAQLNVLPNLIATMPANTDLVYLYSFDEATASQPRVDNVYGSATWTISGEDKLPPGITFDGLTGKFSGTPTAPGSFGPFSLTVSDYLPGSQTVSNLYMTVFLNEDPIFLQTHDIITKVGYPFSTQAPDVSNTFGAYRFYSNDLGASGLNVNQMDGVLFGTLNVPQDVYFNISVTDETLRVTSKPVRVQILPKMTLTAPSLATVSAQEPMTPITVTRANAIGETVWNPIEEGILPEGVTFNTATGQIVGTPDTLGTYGPFTVTSTDSLGDTGVSNQITLRSIAGAFYLRLETAALPKGVKRIQPYSYDFSQLVQIEGMDASELTWSTNAAIPGLSLDPVTGVLSGIPMSSGNFTFTVTASGGGKSSTRTYNIGIDLPSTGLELAQAALPDALRTRSDKDYTYTYDFSPLLTVNNIPKEDVTYRLESPIEGEKLPADLFLSSNGVFTGKTTSEEGTYTFRVTASYVNGTDENFSSTKNFTLKVNDDIKFGFGANLLSSAQKRAPYSFDLAGVLDPSTTEGITPDQLNWSWAVNPDRDPLTTMSNVPAGLYISNGQINGTLTNSGTYDLILTASFEGRTKSKRFVLQSDLMPISLTFKAADLAEGQRKAAYIQTLYDFIEVNNIPKDKVVFKLNSTNTAPEEIAGLPEGIAFSNGVISGTPTTVGTYKFEAQADWSDNNAQAEVSQAKKVFTLVINAVRYKFTELAVASNTVCGITPEGAVLCWGAANLLGTTTNQNGLNPAPVPSLASDVQSIGSNYSLNVTHACAVQSSQVKCWGSNDKGQLGVTPIGVNKSTPSTVPSINDAKKVVTGSTHSCALLTAGTIKCWGANNYGQLGTGTIANTTSVTPTSVVNLSGVVDIASGSYTTCAVLNSGSAWCWGLGTSGQLGNGLATTSGTPVQVNGSTKVTKISASNGAVCMIQNGGVKCWGSASFGKVGNGATSGSYNSPTNTSANVLNTLATDISVGYYHTCAVRNGATYCWGKNEGGVLGNSSSTAVVPTPTLVTALSSGVTAVFAGDDTTCVLQNSLAKCWGQNNAGQLGNGTTVNSAVPVEVVQ